MNSILKYPTAGIILAAGMSRRFGRPKQLAEMDGAPLIHWVLNNSLDSDLDIVVLVLGHSMDEIINSCREFQDNKKLKIVSNRSYSDGMATSLHSGLESVKKEYPSVMFLLADQPFINAKIINHLLHNFWSSDKDICVPIYKENRMNPVIFSSKYYDDIMEVEGDKGARDIIDKNPGQVYYVEFKKDDYFIDIDIINDLNDAEK